jgi:hypothetical protein
MTDPVLAALMEFHSICNKSPPGKLIERIHDLFVRTGPIIDAARATNRKAAEDERNGRCYVGPAPSTLAECRTEEDRTRFWEAYANARGG